MTKDELNARLALTFEPKPTEPPIHPEDVDFSPHGEWVWQRNQWSPTQDFTSDYWFHRLIVEHKITLLPWPDGRWNVYCSRHVDEPEEPTLGCGNPECDYKYCGESSKPVQIEDTYNEDPAIAVAECALKIREAR